MKSGIFISLVTILIIFLTGNANEIVIEKKNGVKKSYKLKDIRKIYFILDKGALIKSQKICNDYLILTKLPKGKISISFEVKPYNLKNQVWFGGFCGPDGRGGIGLFIWNKRLKFTIGNSCNLRYPSEYIEWEIPINVVALNEWNKVNIIYIPSKYVKISINSFEKKAFSNVPNSIPQNKVYIGTDPRHPGRNYNFCGEIKNITY